MEFLQDMKDSVETSVRIQLFPSWEQSSYYHIFKSTLVPFPLSKCKDLHFNTAARPSNDPHLNRTKKEKDLESVSYHRRMINNQGHTTPIWIALKNGEYKLLDGAHRIVATHLEKKETIPAYIIDMDG
uniref:Uncharacterized protein n=1 Tax=viral metagenome TaxID=1070528 RepID=A0A6C0KL59_9ZZZZ